MVDDSIRRCRICGCTDNCACDGGCYWVEEDLCSSCVAHADEPSRLVEVPLAVGEPPETMVFVDSFESKFGRTYALLREAPANDPGARDWWATVDLLGPDDAPRYRGYDGDWRQVEREYRQLTEQGEMSSA